MKKSVALLLLMVSLLMVSCDEQETYFKYQHVPEQGWAQDSILLFDYQIDNPDNPYNLYLHFRHQGDYEYQNVWIFMENLSLRDSVSRKDTIEFYLADDYGKWLGTGSGALKEMSVLFQKHILFPDSGHYQLKLQQGMRDSLLQGVFDVGLRIEAVN